MNVFHEVFLEFQLVEFTDSYKLCILNFRISNEGLLVFGISNHIHNEIKDLHFKPILQLFLK